MFFKKTYEFSLINRFLVRIFSVIFAGGTVSLLSSCSFGPIASTTSLSPAVEAGTTNYNDAVGDASDQILLTNILRAKNLEPLNLTQLSSISGTLSLQGSLGFTLPWGYGVGSNGLAKGQNSGSPSISGSTTPTFSLTPLNTQAFTQMILQPISASYVLNRGQAGIPREVLFSLFVKEIDIPTDSGSLTRYLNDPDDETHLAAFRTLVDKLVKNNATLRAMDILDPVGPEFDFLGAVSQTHPDYAHNDINHSVTISGNGANADTEAFSLVTGSSDGQYHVGNADGKKASKNGQLFRVYSGQVELCVDKQFFTGSTPEKKTKDGKIKPTEKQDAGFAGKAQAQREIFSFVPPSSVSGGGKGTSAAPATASATPSTAGMTATLQAGRVSAIVREDSCHADQIVLPPISERQFADASSAFVHVQWRSLSEVFDYLGAILRYNERHKASEIFKLKIAPDSSIAAEPGFGPPLSVTLFEASKGGPGHLSVWHRDINYVVPDVEDSNAKADYTRAVLSMLSLLINYSSQPAPASSSAPLRLLPIP